MNLSNARMMVQQRRGKPYSDVADFKQRLPRSDIEINDMDFSVTSNFFWVTGRARVANSQVTTQALLQRSAGWPMVVWQSIQ
jgi:type II secretory pathway component PulK